MPFDYTREKVGGKLTWDANDNARLSLSYDMKAFDRTNRETWEETGSKSLYDRACEQVEERLANYTPIETDVAIDTAMRQLIMDGFETQENLPDLPPPPEPKAPKAIPGRRGRAGRRRRT